MVGGHESVWQSSGQKFILVYELVDCECVYIIRVLYSSGRVCAPNLSVV